MNKLENRLLGTNEKVYWVLDQKNTTQFAVAAQLTGNLKDEEWRNALDTVQQRHPNLSVRISGNEYSTVYFEHADQCRIPLRVVHLEKDADWNDIVEQELNQPLDLNIAPLARAVLIQQPGKSVFIFLSNHSIGDGMSVALVIRDVLSVLSGRMITNLSPLAPLDELAGVAIEGNAEVNRKGLQQIKIKLIPRQGIGVLRLAFTTTLTAQLIERSKRENTTVHGALSAALVIAMREKDASPRQQPVRILHPLSVRKILNVGEDFGLLLNITTLPHHPFPGDNFWDLARSVRQEIAETQNAEWIKGNSLGTQELFNSGLDLATIEQALHQGTAHEIMLTNLGLLSFASDFGALQLTSLWGPMVLTPHQAAQTVGVATFNGVLRLTLTGLTPDQNLLQAVEQLIYRACGHEL
jgi:hypothetical protein